MARDAGFSWVIFLLMAMILLASTAVFFVLVRRWTTERRWTTMGEWASERNFHHLRAADSLPPPLNMLPLHAQLALSNGPISFFDFSPPMSEDQDAIHILHRQIDWPIAPGGLRPVQEKISFLDRFKLPLFPLITSNERFVAIGVDSAAARQIADALRTLLPADLGLLVHGRSLLLDFSARHFDTIEFDRMIYLSDQLISRLPSPT